MYLLSSAVEYPTQLRKDGFEFPLLRLRSGNIEGTHWKLKIKKKIMDAN